ncbi:junctional adhesion molecule A isoform X2 [Microcaecilia unicolor]|uniref:Junctional adhesion molecule A n=1 Tax=Microcaecilia unicolor TaxID=1415580 RepID=A0A6P7WI61_9AMPH|nr:junctional adhesion molecule A isoform X2 [Microcaecilia unicolor]
MATGSIFCFFFLAVCSWSGTLGGVTTTTPFLPVDVGASPELMCSYSADFSTPRIEWKFSKEGYESFVYLDGKLTEPYKDRAQFFNTGIRLDNVTPKDNGTYTCEVVKVTPPSLIGKVTIDLLVRVAPSVPTISVPTSVTTGSKAELRCTETNGNPPSTYKWYKNEMLMPENPKSSQTFQNASYTLDAKTGTLTFYPVSKDDTGDYSCSAGNGIGSDIFSSVVRMEVSDVNVGGIVAGVIVAILILALIGFLIWFLCRRGYFSRDASAGKKVIYSQPSETRSDRNFQQTSSFVV